MEPNSVYQCGKCHKWFSEPKKIKTKFYGQILEENACPFCKNTGFTAFSDIDYFFFKDVTETYKQSLIKNYNIE